MRRRVVTTGLLGLCLVAAGPAVARTPLPGVRTPSGNITCFFVPGPPGHLLCDVHRAVYLGRLQDGCMARAGLDWHGFEVYVRRRTDYVCSGGILYNSNTSYPSFTTVPYGKTWQHGAFRCWSRVTGLTCRARTGPGHGIFLSRQSWRGW
jgi:hypothetical protein